MDVAHQQLEALCNTVSVALFILDEQQHCVFMNRAAEALTGYGREEVQGRQLHEVILPTHPDGLPYPPQECPLYQALARNQRLEGTDAFLHKNGRYYHVSFTASPIQDSADQDGMVGMVVEFQDITEHQMAEESLRQSEQHYRELAEAMPHLVWTADVDGKIDYYNRRLERYHSVTRREDGTYEWDPMLHEDDLALTYATWERAAAAGTGFAIEHRIKMADGGYRWHLSRAEPAVDDHGAVVRWYGTATDIHDQKLAEEALRQSNADLEQFIYVAAHDLQEPLRTILLSIDIAIQQSGDADSPWQAHGQRISDNAQRMQRLIADLLTYSQVIHHDEPGADRADLDRALNDALDLLQERIERSEAVIERGPMPVVQGHEGQLSLVFQNLIGNALKYHEETQAPHIQISAERRNRHWVIAVHDAGIGFDPAYAEKIFGLFKRLHRNRFFGTGLGLAICRRIVERHHGRIWAESTPEGPGHGSTFYFSLLATDADHG